MNKKIEAMIKTIALQDLEIELVQNQIAGQIIPDIVFEVLREHRTKYKRIYD